MQTVVVLAVITFLLYIHIQGSGCSHNSSAILRLRAIVANKHSNYVREPSPANQRAAAGQTCVWEREREQSPVHFDKEAAVQNTINFIHIYFRVYYSQATTVCNNVILYAGESDIS